MVNKVSPVFNIQRDKKRKDVAMTVVNCTFFSCPSNRGGICQAGEISVKRHWDEDVDTPCCKNYDPPVDSSGTYA